MDYEYTKLIKPYGTALTPEEITHMGRDGWEEYFPTPEEHLSFQSTVAETRGAISHAFIFRRERKP